MNPEHGYCKCCHNNPAFFDDGLCKHCFNYMMNDLTSNDVVSIMTSLIHRLQKAGDEHYKDVERGLTSWVYGQR